MDKRRWDLVIPIITIFLLLFAIILVLIKNAHDEMTKEVVTTEATTEAEIATASVATPDEAISEQIEPEPTKEVVHCTTTESTTQATTTEDYTTEVFSATVTTEEATTEAYTEEITEEWTEESSTEEYYEEPSPPEEPQEPEPPAEPEESTESAGMTYLGTYTITGYTWTGDPCANGNYPTVGYTVACNSLPLGTVVYIEGIGTRVVEDRVGRSGLIVDVFVDSTSDAYAITGTYDVYIVE